MFLSYFDYMKRRIGAVKDDSNFIKKWGRNYMRAFQEEMEYTALKAIVDPSIDFNSELDRIEKEYCFNEEMQVLLSAVSPSVRWAVIAIHSDLLLRSKQSKEDATQVNNYCRLHMDQTISVELYP